ncbi:hypothetical protein [Paractinoplanes rishiriensis]|uniref:Uncharacterized protein n=1 Tax=Paractinoplanes rishiriensis TaxID=1050105 RepID=A0A919MU76_9ACTN|nr:hypothetical protein [Actinoplanes rishiriensis]GIE95034.1 hypothetical protein Ari01nite_24990 [Actinoplanes rishiriensis]
MTDFTLVLLLGVLGPVLLVEALLARYELLAWTAGWRTSGADLPAGMPYARGAGPDRPPDAYLVYLDGIGKRRFRDTRDGGQLVRALIDGAPELRVLGQVLPYSPLADPLADRPVWRWWRRHLGLLLFLHNVMQIFIAADHRYRPLYNRAVGSQIATQLQRAGYRPGSGVPVVLLGYSGGAQLVTGAVDELWSRLGGPLWLITLGGFHNGANDITHARHLDRLTSGGDRIERIGGWVFPATVASGPLERMEPGRPGRKDRRAPARPGHPRGTAQLHQPGGPAARRAQPSRPHRRHRHRACSRPASGGVRTTATGHAEW